MLIHTSMLSMGCALASQGGCPLTGMPRRTAVSRRSKAARRRKLRAAGSLRAKSRKGLLAEEAPRDGPLHVLAALQPGGRGQDVQRAAQESVIYHAVLWRIRRCPCQVQSLLICATQCICYVLVNRKEEPLYGELVQRCVHACD